MANSASDSSTALPFVLAEIQAADAVARAQLGRRAVEGVPAEVEHEHAVSHGENRLHVLLDDEHGDAPAVQRTDGIVHVGDEAGRERGRGLVEEEESRAHGERAGDGEDALLAAGEAARGLPPAGREERGARVELVHGRARLAGRAQRVAAEQEVLVHGHVAEAHDEWHVVLDDEERAAPAAELADGLGDLAADDRMYTGERLVEQEQGGLDHEVHRKLEQALLADGGTPPGRIDEPHEPEALEPGAGTSPPVAHAAAHGGDGEVLAHGQLAEESHRLERPPDAPSGDLVRRQVVDALTVVEHAPAVGPEQARDEIEDRGLAGAVGPDEADDTARLDLERAATAGAEAAEALLELGDGQPRRLGYFFSHAARRTGTNLPPPAEATESG